MAELYKGNVLKVERSWSQTQSVSRAKSKGAPNVGDHLYIKACQPICIIGKFLLSADTKPQGLKYFMVKPINKLEGQGWICRQF